MRYLVLIPLLIACAKAPRATVVAGPKTIASTWQSTASPNWALNFGNASYSAPFQIRESFWTDGVCESTASISQATASPDTGTITISASFPVHVVYGDPACTMFDGSWPYTVEGGVMTLFYAPTNQTIIFE